MKRYKVTIQPCNPTRVPVPPTLSITIFDQVFRQSVRYRIDPVAKTLKRWNDTSHSLDYLHQIDRLCELCFDFEHEAEDNELLVGSLFHEIGFLHASDDANEFIHKYCEVNRQCPR